jgi:hypothetical protein
VNRLRCGMSHLWDEAPELVSIVAGLVIGNFAASAFLSDFVFAAAAAVLTACTLATAWIIGK